MKWQLEQRKLKLNTDCIQLSKRSCYIHPLLRLLACSHKKD